MVFIASEITESSKALLQIAKNLKKSQVSIDIINICSDSNMEVLKEFFSQVGGEEQGALMFYQ